MEESKERIERRIDLRMLNWLLIEFSAFVTALVVFFIGLFVELLIGGSLFGPLYLSILVFLILTLVSCINILIGWHRMDQDGQSKRRCESCESKCGFFEEVV